MNADAVLVGLIGARIQASRSPRLHEEEARAVGISLSYQLIDIEDLGVEDLPGKLAEAEGSGFAGVNITHPCKQAVLPLLDELSDDAAAIGAVNTVVFSSGRRIGHNTDWYGFSESFKRGLPGASLDKVVLIGAGGAGSAVGFGAMQLGARHLWIHDSDRDRAEALAENLNRQFAGQRVNAASDLAAVMSESHGVIQATPIGMKEYPGMPLSGELLKPDLWVAEIIYFPLETMMLRMAKALGCRTMNGSGMAVFQAAAAFQLFTGIKADTERMFAAFNAIEEETE